MITDQSQDNLVFFFSADIRRFYGNHGITIIIIIVIIIITIILTSRRERHKDGRDGGVALGMDEKKRRINEEYKMKNAVRSILRHGEK